MATSLFYQKPVLLNSGVHKEVRIGGLSGNFRFAMETNSIPLVGVEFFDAAREYPIAFTGNESGSIFPIAIAGVRQNENLFVSALGKWEARYIPAFVRRYPFILAEKPNSEEFDVYFDEAYPGIGEAGGERIFNEDGEYSPLLKQVLEFLTNYQREISRTRLFAERMRALDLLIPRVLEVVRPNEQPVTLQGFTVVNESKLMNLGDTELLDLARTGLLSWVHAHLMSLGNIPVLGERLSARMGAAQVRR